MVMATRHQGAADPEALGRRRPQGYLGSIRGGEAMTASSLPYTQLVLVSSPFLSFPLLSVFFTLGNVARFSFFSTLGDTAPHPSSCSTFFQGDTHFNMYGQSEEFGLGFWVVEQIMADRRLDVLRWRNNQKVLRIKPAGSESASFVWWQYYRPLHAVLRWP